MRLRSRLADRARDMGDALADLEQLWGPAVATAALTIGLGLLLMATGNEIPRVLGPAAGLAIAALVSYVGYWRLRAQRRRRLLRVAGAASRLLDTQIGTGAGEFDALVQGPRYQGVTIRGLARAHRQGRLGDELAYATGLAGGIESQRVDFEQATAHHAERLSPPRANVLVERVILSASDAAAAAGVYESEATDALIEQRYELEKRRARLVSPLDAFGQQLVRVQAAAEALEDLADRPALRQANAERDRRDVALRSTRLELQSAAAAAGEEILASARPPTELDPALAPIVTLRALVPLASFAFASTVEGAALARWRENIEAAHVLAGAVGRRGPDMHERTRAAWRGASDALNDLDRAITDLQQGLETAPKLTPQELASGALERLTTDRRVEILSRAKAVVACVDELRALEVR